MVGIFDTFIIKLFVFKKKNNFQWIKIYSSKIYSGKLYKFLYLQTHNYLNTYLVLKYLVNRKCNNYINSKFNFSY